MKEDNFLLLALEPHTHTAAEQGAHWRTLPFSKQKQNMMGEKEK
jgi:hypothetical protein